MFTSNTHLVVTKAAAVNLWNKGVKIFARRKDMQEVSWMIANSPATLSNDDYLFAISW